MADEHDVEMVIEREQSVLGWPVKFVGGEALIEDEELGRRLGYGDAVTVRKLVERIWPITNRPRRAIVPTAAGGKPRKPYLLTERQVLRVCMRSETPTADQIQDEVIEVFLAVRHGRVPPPQPADPWAAIQAVAVGTLELRAEVKEARSDATTAARAALDATKTAREAKEIAEQARTMAGARGVLDSIASATPPGGSAATPDGAWSAKAPAGYKSMRGVAREYALPSDGVGQGFVGKVARAIGVCEDLHAVAYQDVVIGGRARRQHMLYGPKAIATLDGPLRAAHAAMVARGYVTRHGVLCPAGVGPAKRSKEFVLAEMFEAAASGRSEGPDERQQTIPGVDDQRQAG